MPALSEEAAGRLQLLRERVVWAAQEMARRSLVLGTWGNVSARVDDLMVITPSGMDYLKIQPSDLPVLDASGRTVLGERQPSTEHRLHRAIYQQRPDLSAIVHTHSPYASVLAVVRQPLPPILEELAQVVGGEVPVAEYALPGTAELAERASAALGGGVAVLLPNHGMVGVGRTLREALLVCEIVEKGARVYCYSRILGQPAVLTEDQVAWLRREFLTHYGQRPGRRIEDKAAD